MSLVVNAKWVRRAPLQLSSGRVQNYWLFADSTEMLAAIQRVDDGPFQLLFVVKSFSWGEKEYHTTKYATFEEARRHAEQLLQDKSRMSKGVVLQIASDLSVSQEEG